MVDSKLGIEEPAVPNKFIDAEQLTVAGVVVQRERVQVVGKNPTDIAEVTAANGLEVDVTRIVPSDYNLEVLRGNIPSHSMVNIRGHDDSVPNGGPFGLSPEFGGNSFSFDQSGISATPAAVAIASTDNINDNAGGTGALTARIIGLDASGVAQTADEIMNGTTAVFTSELWSAVFQVVVLTTGSNNANTGVLYVGTGIFTAGEPAVRMLSVDIGFNVSLSAYYVVPTGKTLFPRQFIFTIQSSNKDAAVTIETSPNGILWFRQIEFGLEGGSDVFPIIALPGFVAGTHVQLQAQGSAMNTAITAIFAGELIDN